MTWTNATNPLNDGSNSASPSCKVFVESKHIKKEKEEVVFQTTKVNAVNLNKSVNVLVLLLAFTHLDNCQRNLNI